MTGIAIFILGYACGCVTSLLVFYALSSLVDRRPSREL